MDLPDIQLREDVYDVSQANQNDGNIFQNGAVAPSNSLLATSLESLSFQLARQKQIAGGQVPDFDVLATRLTELATFAASDVVDLKAYASIMDSNASVAVKMNAYRLASMKTCAHSQRNYRMTLASLRENYIRTCMEADPAFWVTYFSKITFPIKLTENDKKYLMMMDNAFIEYVEADYEELGKTLLNEETCTAPVSQAHLPGFRINFQFKDKSVISSTCRYQLDSTTSLVVERNVAGPEALGVLNSMGANYYGLFSIFCPPSPADLDPSNGNISAHQIAITRAKKIVETAVILKAALTDHI